MSSRIKKKFRTRLCDVLNIEYPIMLAGMGDTSLPRLVAAVSNAGGFGVLGCSRRSPDLIRRMIRETRELTDKPFGVDTTIPQVVPTKTSEEEVWAGIPKSHIDFVESFKSQHSVPDVPLHDDTLYPPEIYPPYNRQLFEAQVEVILDERVSAYISGMGNPSWIVPQAHAKGVLVGALVGNRKNARKVAEGGVDFVVAQGSEAAGHCGRIGGMALIPQVIDVVQQINPECQVVYSGGVTDGRQIVGAVAMGAVGVWCGTAFLVAEECEAFPEWAKQAILAADDEGTFLSRIGDGMPMRFLKPCPWEEARENSGLPPLPLAQERLLGWSVRLGARKAGLQGVTGEAAGQGVGLINRIQTAKQIIEEMVDEASEAHARFGKAINNQDTMTKRQ